LEEFELNEKSDKNDPEYVEEKRSAQEISQQLLEQAKPLFESFLLTQNDLNEIVFQAITVKSDSVMLNPMVYYPRSIDTSKKIPCIIWFHEGHINTTDYMYVESPIEIQLCRCEDETFISSLWKVFDSNATIGLQPLVRFLFSQGIAFATITMSPKESNGNIREQVKAHVSRIKDLYFINTDKMAFFEHSYGGNIASLLMVHGPQFLKDNFILSVGLVSSYLNEVCDMENNSLFNYAFPNDKSLPEDCKK
jgi:hypothetical protein